MNIGSDIDWYSIALMHDEQEFSKRIGQLQECGAFRDMIAF